MKISLVALALIALSATNVSADSGNACQDMFRFTGMPEYSGPMENHVIRCRSGYVLLNNGNTRVPDWVLEVLTEERLQGDAVRKDNFRNDTGLDANGTAVAAAEVAEKKDYVGSGYDRGHNAPAADMAWDQGAMDESFFMTNMAPQVGIGFNRYIWKHLEAYVRDLTKERGPLVAITGPIYTGPERFLVAVTKKDGEKVSRPTDVRIPDAFFKIVYWPETKRAIAFRLPNRKFDHKDYAAYRVTIDSIEAETGLDFLTSLSWRDQKRIEHYTSPMWRAF